MLTHQHEAEESSQKCIYYEGCGRVRQNVHFTAILAFLLLIDLINPAPGQISADGD